VVPEVSTEDDAVTWVTFNAVNSPLRINHPADWSIIERDQIISIIPSSNSNFSVTMQRQEGGNPDNLYADDYISQVLEPKYLLKANNITALVSQISSRDAIILTDVPNATSEVDLMFILDGTTLYKISVPGRTIDETNNKLAHEILRSITFPVIHSPTQNTNLENFDNELFSFLYPDTWKTIDLQDDSSEVLKLYYLEDEGLDNSVVLKIFVHPETTVEALLKERTISETTDITIGGATGKAYELDTWAHEYIILLTAKNGNVIEIASASQNMNFTADINNVLRTFYLQP
jgi:hypothetical protein